LLGRVEREYHICGGLQQDAGGQWNRRIVTNPKKIYIRTWSGVRAFGSESILVRVEKKINGMGEALLDHTGINFENRNCQRNGAITGRRSAVLLIAFINHDDFAEFPVVRGGAQQETVVVVREEVFLGGVWKES
jgi:hypothetical protein